VLALDCLAHDYLLSESWLDVEADRAWARLQSGDVAVAARQQRIGGRREAAVRWL
jgi:hypothetical protein